MKKKIFAAVGITIALILYLYFMTNVALPKIYSGPFSYYIWIILCIMGFITYFICIITLILSK